MTPNFIQFFHLPGDVLPPQFEYMRDWRLAFPIHGTYPSGAGFTRSTVHAAVTNEGHMAIVWFEVVGSIPGQAGYRRAMFIYSNTGGQTWDEPRELPFTRSSLGSTTPRGLISAAASTDGTIYILGETSDGTVQVCAIDSDGDSAALVFSQGGFSSRYYVFYGNANLVQQDGTVYFFVNSDRYAPGFTIRARNGIATRAAAVPPTFGSPSAFVNTKAFSVIQPGGFLPRGEIWLMQSGDKSTDQLESWRSINGGDSWEPMGGITPYGTYARPFHLFINEDGTRTLVSQAYSSNFGTGEITWNRHDGDGWLFPVEYSQPYQRPPEMQLFPLKQGFNAQYQSRLLTGVGDRFAIAYNTWNDGQYGEQQVQFFGTDGAPTNKIVIDSLSGSSNDNSWSTPSVVVGLTGQITSSMTRYGRVGTSYFSEHYFRRGNDQGFGPKLLPAIGDADDAISQGRFPIQISQNRRHELAAVSFNERVSGVYVPNGEKIYITSNSLP